MFGQAKQRGTDEVIVRTWPDFSDGSKVSSHDDSKPTEFNAQENHQLVSIKDLLTYGKSNNSEQNNATLSLIFN